MATGLVRELALKGVSLSWQSGHHQSTEAMHTCGRAKLASNGRAFQSGERRKILRYPGGGRK